MAKIILQHRPFGWTAWFYGVALASGTPMPEDVEIPLPFTADAPLATVAADVRRRFPGARLMYRDQFEHLSHVGV